MKAPDHDSLVALNGLLKRWESNRLQVDKLTARGLELRSVFENYLKSMGIAMEDSHYQVLDTKFRLELEFDPKDFVRGYMVTYEEVFSEAGEFVKLVPIYTLWFDQIGNVEYDEGWEYYYYGSVLLYSWNKKGRLKLKELPGFTMSR